MRHTIHCQREQGAAAPIFVIEPAHVSPTERLHHQADALPLFGRGEQMQMVVHQDIGMDDHLMGLCTVSQQADETLPVGIIEHDGLAVVAALDDVVRMAGEQQAGKSGHVATLNGVKI